MNGRYQPPSLESLVKSIDEAKYTGNRIESLQRLQSFAKETISHEALIGACIYSSESIDNEYSFISSEKSLGYFWNSGSSLNKEIIRDMLQVTPNNLLDDRTKFIYLIHFLQHLNSANCSIPNKQEIIKDVTAKTKILLEKLAPDIEGLLKNPSTEEVFLQDLAALPQEYKSSSQSTWPILSWFTGSDKSRSAYVKCIDELAKIYSALPQKLQDKAEEKKPQPDTNIVFDGLYGIVLTIMLEIEASYYTRSPENSKLYKLCQRILNVNSTNELKNSDKIFYLKAASYLMSCILKSPDLMSQWKETGFKNAADFFNGLQSAANKHEENLKIDCGTTSTRVNYALDSAATSTAQYAIFTLLFAGERFAIKNLTFAASSAILAPQYAMACAIVFALRKQIASFITSNLVWYTRSYLVSTVKFPIKLAYGAVTGLKHLSASSQTATMPLEKDYALIMSLLAAPEKIFNEQKKEQLKKVVNIKQAQAAMEKKEMQHSIRKSLSA